MNPRSSSQIVSPLWFQGGVLFSLLALVYGHVFRALVQEWYEHQYFSYGFLIIPIFVYLVWQKRELLARLTPKSTPWGVMMLLGALMIGFVGRTVEDPFTMRLSMVLAFVSLIYLLLGTSYVKVLAFPLTYLFLVIPPPFLFVKEISSRLRILVAFFSSHALQSAGVPTYWDAYFLHLPNITLEVADDCSGIASLFAMLAVGLLYVHLLPVGLGSKALVMIGAVVFPVAANLLRVFLVGFTVYYYGPIMLDAFFHKFSGTFTFGLALVALIAFGEFVSRKWPRKGSKRRLAPGEETGLKGRTASVTPLGSLHFFLALAIFAGGFYLSAQLSVPHRVSLNSDLRELPATLGNYVLSKATVAEPYEDPNAQAVLSRRYDGGGDKQVELFIGYRGYQDGQNRLLSPKLVLPASWNSVWVKADRIEIPGFASIDASWMLTQKGETQRLVLYWYQARSRSFGGEIRYRVDQVVSVFSSGRTDGAIVRIATTVGDIEQLEDAKERIEKFSTHLYPHLARMLPE